MSSGWGVLTKLGPHESSGAKCLHNGHTPRCEKCKYCMKWIPKDKLTEVCQHNRLRQTT